MIIIKLEKVEQGIVSIYENETREKLVNARELFYELRGSETKTKFSDWIKQRLIKYQFIKGEDYISFRNFTKGDEKGFGNKSTIEYYLTIDTVKEICMIENNAKGRIIRKYFIEAEKRYRQIINSPQNIFDFMRLALNEIEKNENKINKVEKLALENKCEIKSLKSLIDIKIQNNYCLA